MKKIIDLIRSAISDALKGRRTVIFVIDGLGKTDLNLPYPREVYETVFPSTTTSFVYTFHSLLPPGEHGFLEWYGHCNKVDEPVIYLASKTASEKMVDIPPRELFPFKSVFNALSEKGLKAAVFAPYIDSPFSKITYDQKVNTRKIRTLSDIFPLPDFDFLYIYWPEIDTILHEKWKDESFFVELKQVKSIIERLVKKLPKGTEIIILSDHGLKKCVKEIPLKKINGILPYGGGRVAFYNSGGNAESFKKLVTRDIKGDYYLHHISDLKDLLGGIVSKRCIEQYGDIVLIANGDYGFVYPYEKSKKEINLGYHGGLSDEEREVYVWRIRI